jgi:hypothetical protein
MAVAQLAAQHPNDGRTEPEELVAQDPVALIVLNSFNLTKYQPSLCLNVLHALLLSSSGHRTTLFNVHKMTLDSC